LLRNVGRLAIFPVVCLILTACGAGPGGIRDDSAAGTTLTISAIPDQDPEKLQRLYGVVADYLSTALDVDVRYLPVTDYTASVVSYERGDIQLAFFGGFTGVQARLQVPGSQPIAQRDIDEEFRSVFVANTAAGIEPIADVSGLSALAGHSLTFGSDASTSGRLMPQHFLSEAGLTLSDFDGEVGFSNSHDATAKLVEAGTYEVGALNAAVWDDRTTTGAIDTTKVAEIFRTPIYHDYHWLIRPDVDDTFGDGFTERVTDALLGIDGDTEQERTILELFQANGFIPSKPENYDQIEQVARSSGMVR
jgi:phosphonate transport system substrate-binding protein